MFGVNGFQLLAMLKGDSKKLPPIIFITGSSDKKLEEEAKSSGVFKFFTKHTLTQEALSEAVQNAVLAKISL